MWKKLSDGFPAHQQEVILYFKNSNGWHVSTAVWDGNTFIEECCACGCKVPWTYSAVITHWQPLPEPPSSNVVSEGRAESAACSESPRL